MRESEIQGDSEQLINTASLFLFLTNNPLPPPVGVRSRVCLLFSLSIETPTQICQPHKRSSSNKSRPGHQGDALSSDRIGKK